VSEPKKPFQLFRRDFLVGAVGGVTAGFGLTRAATAVAHPDLTSKVLLDGATISYAQQGEDLVLHSLFRNFGGTPPTYLDIGAYEPVRRNNTYFFYARGSKGVLVEPNVDMADKCRRVRPRDTVLTVGIGVTDDPAADFYLMTEPELHTLDKEQAERLQRDGFAAVVSVIKMPLVNVNAVIDDHFGGSAPDLLSIDVEGLELPILKTFDFARFRPKVVCADTLVTGTRRLRPETAAFMAAHGYEVRSMTYANTIFVDAKLI
jgi:FkbM family methyltransferase